VPLPGSKHPEQCKSGFKSRLNGQAVGGWGGDRLASILSAQIDPPVIVAIAVWILMLLMLLKRLLLVT